MTINLIDMLLNDDKHSDEIILNAKLLTNALTTQVVSLVIAHVAASRRPAEDSVPTNDERNEQDAEIAALISSLETRTEQGHESPILPLHIAEICDALRFNVYNELHRFDDSLPTADKALVHEEPRNPLAKINFNQPMSAEGNLNYRIKMSATPNEGEIQRAMTTFNKPEDFVRSIFRADAQRQVVRLFNMKPEVMTEIAAFDKSVGSEAFSGLPLQIQIRIAEKVATGLDKEYKRLFPQACRTGSLELSNKLVLVEANYKETTAWIDTQVKQHAAVVE